MEMFKKGAPIIKFGDDGEKYYLLTRGTVKCILYKPETDPNDPNLEDKIMLTKDLPTGITFGEIALLYNAKRSATIVANDDCLCWTLDGTIFKTEIAKSSIATRQKKADFLDSIALFGQLDKFQKLKLIDTKVAKKIDPFAPDILKNMANEKIRIVDGF